MQSHSSRHVVSEHLCDRLPASPVNWAKETAGVREAYGHQCTRGIVKRLSELQSISADAIRSLASLLSTQEVKAEAVRAGAPALLIGCVGTQSVPLTEAACSCLCCLARIMSGLEAIIKHQGIASLIAALRQAPVEASQCIMEISRTMSGSRAVLGCNPQVISELAKVFQDLEKNAQATKNLIETWALLCRYRSGVAAALTADLTAFVTDTLNSSLARIQSDSAQLELCRTCLEFLVQMSHDEEGKSAILDAKAIPVLAECLKQQDEKLVVTTVNALMGITIDPAGKVPTIQVAGRRLIELLKGEPSMPVDLQHGCRAVLVNAAEHPVARKLLAVKLPLEEQAVFLGPLPPMPSDYQVSGTIKQ